MIDTHKVDISLLTDDDYYVVYVVGQDLYIVIRSVSFLCYSTPWDLGFMEWIVVCHLSARCSSASLRTKQALHLVTRTKDLFLTSMELKWIC